MLSVANPGDIESMILPDTVKVNWRSFSNDCDESCFRASIRVRRKQIEDNPKRTTGASIAVARERMPNGFRGHTVLQTNRREYRGITSDGLDRASAAP
ncbi:hypothetical protein [Bradyrhizobium sp.]|uniref:hypothetical protein n=1 Tax=Bradyrhizobium sp. TaxID=376 RepID=UPI0025BDEE35|nr:hypothetical protein [Bradyrhizobium sp.]